MAFNKGEWSELYAILYLMVHQKLKLVNCKLEVLNDNIFTVKSIISEKKLGDIIFEIQDNKVYPTVYNNKLEAIDLNEIKNLYESMFDEICNNSNGAGSFNIKSLNYLFSLLGIKNNLKSISNKKDDVILISLDANKNMDVKLSYSIKSQIGSPATILNSSKHTNFIYRVKNISDNDMEYINSINTHHKLKDRIYNLQNMGADIEFIGLSSNVFERNLKMVDYKLPEVLAEVLLKSYKNNEKNLKKLFYESTIYKSKNLSEKKLKDFLEAISFGIMPSKEWNGINKVNGGIIIVSNNKNIYVLDMIYFSDEVRKYLLENTKLDSPSSKRYNMLNIYKENNNFFFTLNLQVRYIK